MSFSVVACQRLNGHNYDVAHVPLLVMEYLWAPTEWVMADGPAGIEIIYHFRNKVGLNLKIKVLVFDFRIYGS